MTTKIRFATLAVGLVLTAVVSPAVAYPVSAARAQALRECSALQQKELDYLWGVQQDDIYRACMAEKHQPE